MKITEALNEIIDNLNAAGLAATDTPGQVQLPGALVLPGLIEFAYMDSETFNMDFQIYLLAANKGSISLDHLQDSLGKFRTVYPVTEAKPVSIPLSQYPEPCPALSITLSLRITKD
ncbi:hypothetical protein [Arthrobacter sp. BF1]|uniref:hypothetical protein n=1 Tax=Arthrobacter sp. BF1 TaxID=2821145 RepID=UPI001C501F1A|nr:hypothetical protein [Arthrobacter sp. BF1]